MIVVIDANVLLRFADTSAAQHPIAVAALAALKAQGESLRTLPQTHYEFWAVATRPVANNGLGLTITECDKALSDIEILFPLLPDPPALVTTWRGLVVANACHGRVAHDAPYVAALNAHAITHLLTFNNQDFARFQGITAIDPACVSQSPKP